ncbi:hypothetical protein COK29_33420, partial [Bacillus cereus]|uniref:hypothetical protein n=1 Tax=Bacillus cereus TaxID=1396 RepID=UPI000BF2D829
DLRLYAIPMATTLQRKGYTYMIEWIMSIVISTLVNKLVIEPFMDAINDTIKVVSIYIYVKTTRTIGVVLEWLKGVSFS